MRPEHTRALDDVSASKSMPGIGCSRGKLCNIVLTFLGLFFKNNTRQSLPRKHSGLGEFFLLEPKLDHALLGSVLPRTGTYIDITGYNPNV